MLRLYNSLGKRLETFQPVRNDSVTMFTCGPSVYQRSHIGNFRTFLFEDILVRYLQYKGYRVLRGMNFTDIEDKGIAESKQRNLPLKRIADENIRIFLRDMKLLNMQIPDYLPRASEHVDDAVDIIKLLLDKGIAYRHGKNVYFDPLQVPGFGKLYGLDMAKWPKRKRRFHRDTYPGIQWNLGDFVLWHGYREDDPVFWETGIGRGRPSWNIQDPSMIKSLFSETLSIYCGGIDNLFRHHDYTLAVLESIRPYPMAAYWLHCQHLYVDGRKMSKSKGNIYYVSDLTERGYAPREIRFFLIYNHYHTRLNYSDKAMQDAVLKLRELRRQAGKLVRKAHGAEACGTGVAQEIEWSFGEQIDSDLDVRSAFDSIYEIVLALAISEVTREDAAGAVQALRRIDDVLRVIF